MIGAQQFADLRMHARLAAAFGFDFRTSTCHLVHVGRRATDVTDGAFEIWIVGHRVDLVDDRFFAARLNHAPLMCSDRAESTTTKTATHDRDRIFDHRVRRDFFFVAWMLLASVR